MPFRSSDEAVTALGIPEDPWRTFLELHEAFDVDRGFLGDRVPLRYAAVTLLSTGRPAADVVARVRELDAALADLLSWTSDIGSSIRILMAALLFKSGDTAEEFLAEVDRVRAEFRAVKMRRGGAYEAIAVLVMRQRNGLRPIAHATVARFKAIYEAMKHHHWWLTGPDDFPACAILVGQEGEPAAIGDEIEAVYQALHRDANLWRGEALQTAANVLYLSGLDPHELSRRFERLTLAFRKAGVKIGLAEYDEVAVLCFLARPVEKIVESVVELRDRVREALSGMGKRDSFGLATSIAFVQLVAGDDDLGPLADAKLMLDMQAIIAARQAAAAAAAASGGASV